MKNRILLIFVGIIMFSGNVLFGQEPDIDVTPKEFVEEISFGQELEKSMIIQNKGDADLEWQLPVGYDSTSFQTFNASQDSTIHYFHLGVVNVEATLIITINGDYGSSSEFATLYLDGELWGQLPEPNSGDGVDIVNRITISKEDMARYTADEFLIIYIINSSSVGSGYMNKHTVRLVTNGTSDWMSFSKVIGELPASQSDTIQVTFDATSLAIQEHKADLVVRSNDPDTPEFVIPSTVTVLGPSISVKPQELTVDLVEGASKTETISITNSGPGMLDYSLKLSAQIPSENGINGHVERQYPTYLSVSEILQANYNYAAYELDARNTLTGTLLNQSPSKLSPVEPEVFDFNNNEINDNNLIRVAVVRGGGTNFSDVIRCWDHLNQNWNNYGDKEIIIDYNSLRNAFTFADLEQLDADVLIVSVNMSNGGTLTENECKAIVKYVENGHGLYISAATFNNYYETATRYQVQYLAPLVGLDPSLGYIWGNTNPRPVYISDPSHLLWKDIQSPFAVSYSGSTVSPYPDTNWETAIVDGELLAISTDKRTAVITKQNRVYHSSLPEINSYSGNVDVEDMQFVYNAIHYAAFGSLYWCSLESNGGLVENNQVDQVNMTIDATRVDAGEHTGYLSVTSNDLENSEIVVPLTLNVTDNVAPGAVDDFEAVNTASTFATFTWTASGDNDDQGVAEEYEIRYLKESITEANWSSAVAVKDSLPVPLTPGTLQSVRITDLQPNSIYYFALKVRDEVDQYSPLSNVVKIETPDFVNAILYFPFEEISGDVAVNFQGDTRFNGQLMRFDNLDWQDATSTSGWTQYGYLGSAIKFDGSNDYVSVPDFAGSELSLNTGLTLKMAVKMRADILPTGSYSFYDLLSKTDNTSGYVLRFNRENGRLRFMIQYGNNSVAIFESKQSYWVSGEWYEIMVTYDYDADDDNVKIYINNQLDSSYRENRLLSTNSSPVVIGGSNAYYSSFFPGTIDEVLVHNIALEPDVNHAPGSFSLLDPANNIQLDTLNYQFNWQRANDADGDSVIYKISFSDDLDFTNIVLNETLVDTFYTVKDGLIADSLYYWQVEAIDSEGARTLCERPFAFRTSFAATRILDDLVPVSFELSQNYPNPFNPQTRFRYSVPRVADVTISIYNINGQLIETLYNGSSNPGVYEIQWNAQDHPSGTYFIKMDTEGFQQIQKALYLK